MNKLGFLSGNILSTCIRDDIFEIKSNDSGLLVSASVCKVLKVLLPSLDKRKLEILKTNNFSWTQERTNVSDHAAPQNQERKACPESHNQGFFTWSRRLWSHQAVQTL